MDKTVPIVHETEVEKSHIHNVDHVVKHYKAGDHVHHKDIYKHHAAGHTLEHEKVQDLVHRNGKRK